MSIHCHVCINTDQLPTIGWRTVRGTACAGGALDSWSPRIGCRVSIYDVQTGKRVQTLGGPTPGERPDQFISLHSIAVDSKGDIYCAEVSNVDVGSRMDPPREMMSLRKWRRC